MRSGTQGRRASPEHPASPRLFLLDPGRAGADAADPPGGEQAHVARGVDQQLLRTPGAGRDPGRRGPPPGQGRARRHRRAPRAGAAGLPLPRCDGRRDGRERGVPGVHSGAAQRARAEPGGGRLVCAGSTWTSSPPPSSATPSRTARGCASNSSPCARLERSGDDTPACRTRTLQSWVLRPRGEGGRGRSAAVPRRHPVPAGRCRSPARCRRTRRGPEPCTVQLSARIDPSGPR